jgi:peroxiredoxin
MLWHLKFSRWIIHSLGLLALLFASGILAVSASAELKEGQQAPSFKLTLFDKSKQKSDELKNKVIVINYWATWCGPCKAEMPMMSQFYHTHKNKGLEMFGVITKDSVPIYKLKAVDDALSYPLVRKLSGRYGIVDNAVPTTYIIGRDGTIRLIKTGSFTDKEFSDIVLPLLDEPEIKANQQI